MTCLEPSILQHLRDGKGLVLALSLSPMVRDLTNHAIHGQFLGPDSLFFLSSTACPSYHRPPYDLASKVLDTICMSCLITYPIALDFSFAQIILFNDFSWFFLCICLLYFGYLFLLYAIHLGAIHLGVCCRPSNCIQAPLGDLPRNACRAISVICFPYLLMMASIRFNPLEFNSSNWSTSNGSRHPSSPA